MRAGTLLVAVSLALALAPAPAAAAPAVEVAHRDRRLELDGGAGDWQREGAIVFARPTRGGEPPARAVVHLAWDRDALWALFEVTDAAVHLAPPRVQGAELFQWDSVEVYVDGRGDRAERMGPDDFQLILTADGRSAALQGDPLLHELEGLQVPKRERPALTVAVAGSRHRGGYVVEAAIPWAAVGVVPRPGQRLALDLAFNDWLADHPPLDQLAYDLRTLHKLEAGAPGGTAIYDHHGLARDTAAAVERALYRPWAWSGSGDFGYPRRWRPVRLVGAPPLGQRLLDTAAPAALLTAVGVAVMVVGSGFAAAVAARYRRRVAALLDRMTTLEAEHVAAALAAAERRAAHPGPPAVAATASGAPPPAAPERLELLARAAAAGGAEGQPEPLELRAIRAIQLRLAETVTPTELAAALFVSLRTLQRHLAEELACTPGELILALKMREARRLLESGAWQVQEVARRVGFDDPAYFSRRFRSHFGVAPAAVLGGPRKPAEAGTTAA